MQKRFRLEHLALALTLVAFATTGRAPRLVTLGPRDLSTSEAPFTRLVDSTSA